MSKIREVFLCTEHTSSKEVLIFTNSWTSMTSLFLEAFWRFPWTLLLCCCMFWCYGMDSWWCFSFSFVKCNIKFYATVLFSWCGGWLNLILLAFFFFLFFSVLLIKLIRWYFALNLFLVLLSLAYNLVRLQSSDRCWMVFIYLFFLMDYCNFVL